MRGGATVMNCPSRSDNFRSVGCCSYYNPSPRRDIEFQEGGY